jgi:hypothetical protein
MENTEFVNLVKQAIEAFKEQNTKSESFGACKYLRENNDGTKLCCIVGHMMPNDEVRKRADKCLSETGIYSLWEHGFEWAQQFSTPQIKFLGGMQNIHDSIYITYTVQEAVEIMEEKLEEYISSP